MHPIALDNVVKNFKVFHERNQSLKHSTIRRRRESFTSFRAVDGLTLAVERGHGLGLIGGNGAGKSTTLKMIARILKPDAGTITLCGRVSAMIELGAGFHPDLSGRDNIYLNGTILGLSKKEVRARFNDIVDFSGLARFLDNPVKTYSSGMYARLGFSVASNTKPDILLVDEVLAVGDNEFQASCRRRILELKSEGTTIVIVSHGLHQIRELCDTAAWLQRGKLVQLDEVNKVVDAYETSAQSNIV